MTLAVLAAAATTVYTLLTHQPPRDQRQATSGIINTLWAEGRLDELIERAPAAIEDPDINWSRRAQMIRNLGWAYEETAARADDAEQRRERLSHARATWELLREHCETPPTEPPTGPISEYQIDYWKPYALLGLGREDKARELWRRVAKAWLELDTNAMEMYAEKQARTRPAHRGSFPIPTWAAPVPDPNEPPKESADSDDLPPGLSASRAAHALGMLGERRAAIEALELAARRHELPANQHLLHHRAFEDLLDDPKYRAILTWRERTPYWTTVQRLLIAREHRVLTHLAKLQTAVYERGTEGWLSLAFALRAQDWPEDEMPPDRVWERLLSSTQPNERGRIQSYKTEHKAWALLGTGEPERARTIFARVGDELAQRIYDNIELADAAGAHRAAAAFSMAGEIERALDMLTIAAGDPGFNRPWAMTDPALEAVRRDPRFSSAIRPNRGSSTPRTPRAATPRTANDTRNDTHNDQRP